MAVDADTEKRLIRAAWDMAVTALTERNWEAYSQFWAHEPYIDVIHPAARDWTSGWDQVATKYRAFIEAPIVDGDYSKVQRQSRTLRRLRLGHHRGGDLCE